MFKQRGAIPLPILIAVIFVAIVLVVAGHAPFKDRFAQIFIKPDSFAAPLQGNYIDQRHLSVMPWGKYSHWFSPWRAYQETVPASTFVNGIGMHFNADHGENPDMVMKMLATHGIKNVRIGNNWGNMNYDNEAINNNAAQFQAQLTAAKKYGIRPLILLNANDGLPVPVKRLQKSLPSGATLGATTITINDTSGIIPGFTGFSDKWAADILVTAINGNTLTVSKPLPQFALPGTAVTMTTLKYRPFSTPGSADFNNTINGWNNYVKNTAVFAANVLGTTNSSDKGFDMEIWNELTFGSNFLNINNYYLIPQFTINKPVWELGPDGLVNRTASFVAANPTIFSGVQFNDGFSNTSPWDGAGSLPAQISAIGKHPYKLRMKYPADDYHNINPGVHNVNALGQVDNSFVPTYEALFPEYFAEGLQTETMIRDIGPFSETYGNIQHGRYARGTNSPVPVWITEVNFVPIEDNPNISAAEALNLKAKAATRYLAFYLNKGVTRLHFFGVDTVGGAYGTSGDKAEGMVQDNFLALARQAGAIYPADDSSYTSPALRVIKRMADKMADQMDSNLNLQTTRPINVNSLAENHNHIQFQGDGTPAHPNLYNRDVFAFLPYQVNSHKFVIPYYVMTRDYSKTLAPEQYTIKFSGIKGAGSNISVYDPINNTSIPFTLNSADQNNIDITLTATDYPYMLIVDESGPASSSQPTSSPSPSLKVGDLDNNGTVDIFDYNQLLTDFGKTGSGLVADIDKAGDSANKVDIFDYNLLLTNFGK